MTKTWKIGVLLAAIPTLAWSFQSPHAEPVSPDATEAESPFDGHYERTGTGENEASLDILQVGPGILRIKGLALWVGNAETGNVNIGDISGTVKPERLKGHFENQDGCKLDILFHADGLKVENTSTACGGLNVTFDGEYKRTGPSAFGGEPQGR